MPTGRSPSAQPPFDAAIVGAGPAGASCALWLQQLGFRPILIERQSRCGGLQLSNPYTNTWIASSAQVTGREVADALHANMLAHRVELRLDTLCQSARLHAEGVELQLSGPGGAVATVQARHLVLAGGVVPRSAGLRSRLGLIVGPGMAVADTDLRGARVAILGGGDNAFENWQFAMARGAASVTIFARSVRARASLVDQVPAACVCHGPFELDAPGQRVNGERFDQILVLFGYEPAAQALLGLEPALRSDGFVWTDAQARTSLPGVYAIGELAQRAHPCCATAMADGVVAAKAIQRELESTVAARSRGMVRRLATAGAKLLG